MAFKLGYCFFVVNVVGELGFLARVRLSCFTFLFYTVQPTSAYVSATSCYDDMLK